MSIRLVVVDKRALPLHSLNRSNVRIMCPDPGDNRGAAAPGPRKKGVLALSVLTDPSTYPISAAAARQLDRALFGHVIDGESCRRSRRHHARMGRGRDGPHRLPRPDRRPPAGGVTSRCAPPKRSHSRS